MSKLLSIACCALLFFGCAHVSKKDCLEKDWQEVGRSDAIEGKSFADLNKVAESCRRFEMNNPPENQYEIGYKYGLKTYCIGWQEKGESDGAEGYERIGTTTADSNCSRISPITLPSQQYEIGYILGLKKHCIAELGLRAGEQGAQFPSACSERRNEYPALVKAYNNGVKTYCNFDQGRATAERGSRHNAVCEKSQHLAYFKGFEQGARTYCADPRRSFLAGKSGSGYFDLCPADLTSAFASAYAQGTRIRKAMQSLNHRISELDTRISNLRYKSRSVESSIDSSQREIESIDSKLRSIDSDIGDIDRRLSDANRRNVDDDRRSTIDRLERDRRSKKDDRRDRERKRSRITNSELPDLFNDRTRLAIEIGNAQLQRSSLQHDLSMLEAKDYRP